LFGGILPRVLAGCLLGASLPKSCRMKKSRARSGRNRA
jgi:hypothetical protein